MERSRLTCAVLMVCSAIGVALAAEPNAKASASPELPKDVREFCDRALARDRGVVHMSFFLGSADHWLAISVSMNDRLRDRLRLSSSQATNIVTMIDEDMLHRWQEVTKEELVRRAKQATGDGKPDSAQKGDEEKPDKVGPKQPDEELLTYFYDEDLEKRLARVLSAKQQDQLDLLYLNIEGLSALIRPHLSARLSLSSDQQNQIRKLVQESVSEDGRRWERAVFTLNGEHVKTGPPIIRSELRKCALRDDLAVGSLLTEKQLDQLATIVKEASSWEKLVITPGKAYPPTLKEIEEAGKP